MNFFKNLFLGRSKLKILRICPAPGHLTKFRTLHCLNKLSWSEQVKSLQSQNIFLTGSWAWEMENYGCNVFDSLYDDDHEDLVRKWADENKFLNAYTQTNPKFDILLNQA